MKEEKLKLKKDICKDVLKRLKNNTISLTNNLYITNVSYGEPNFEDCDVCALGAISLAYFNRNKDVDINKYYTTMGACSLVPSGRLYRLFTGLFTEEELNEIEVFYEGGDVNDYYYEKNNFEEDFSKEDKKYVKLINLHKSFKSNKERLRWAMENIIKNGRFRVKEEKNE